MKPQFTATAYPKTSRAPEGVLALAPAPRERGSVATRVRRFFTGHQINAWVIFFLLVYAVLVIRFVTFRELTTNILFGTYSLTVSLYILSRFLLAYFHEPELTGTSSEPRATFGVPCKNEEAYVRETILRIVRSDYPKDKIEVIVINDGSTDNSLREMQHAREIALRDYGVPVTIVDWSQNRGKRDGMAECVRRASGEIVVFVDSDSFVEPGALRALVGYFADPRVAAVAGQAYVQNADRNVLTRMQSVKYFVAFQAYKAAEALFGAVTCCSGCLAGYRRTAALEVIDAFERETFLGVRCTYGDDRSLTNLLLARGYRMLFAPEARVHTIVPEDLRGFLRQQLRWKKSWTRETLKATAFMWKRHPIAALSFYLGFFLPIVAPAVVLRAVLYHPYVTGQVPWMYLLGLLLMAIIFGLYYDIHARERRWYYGVLSVFFYAFVLVWQLPYAFLTIRDSRWGTR